MRSNADLSFRNLRSSRRCARSSFEVCLCFPRAMQCNIHARIERKFKLKAGEKSRKCYSQPLGNQGQVEDGDIALAALDVGQKAAVDADFLCKFDLRQALLSSKLADSGT